METAYKYFFIAGTGRSGTTILRRSLGLHPEIYYGGKENNIVQDVIGIAQTNCRQPTRQASMLVTQLEYDRAFRNLLTQLIWPECDRHKTDVLQAAINPSAEIMDYLVEIFPNALILGLVRNGIETVASRMKHRSFAHLSFEKQCETWVKSHGVLQWGKRHPEQFRLFRHEWTYQTEELDRQLSAIFDWLGIGACPEVYQNFSAKLWHPSQAPIEPSETWSFAKKAQYFKKNSENWQQWSVDQQSVFKEICGPMMDELGYPIRF